MKKIIVFAAGLLLAATAFNATAQSVLDQDNGLSYSYVQLGYNQVSRDNAFNDETADAPGLTVSVAVTSHIYILGSIEQNKYDWTTVTGAYKYSTTDKFTPLQIGVGYHLSVATGLDVFGSLQYKEVKQDYDYNEAYKNNVYYKESDNDSTSGYVLNVGARYSVNDALSFKGSVYHSDVSDFDTETGIALSGIYNFVDHFGVDLQAHQDISSKNDAKLSSYGLFLRYSF